MRSVIATLGVLALALGLFAAYAPRAQAQYPGPTQGESVSISQANSPITLDRHAGPTRYETSAEIATDAYNASTDVVIASGEEFADALAGAALEGMLDAPVLLVPSDLVNGAIPTATTDAIDDLGATDATILGGTNAVSSDVVQYIEDNSTVDNTARVAGPTRFETAQQIAEEVGNAGSVPDAVADEFGLSEDANASFLATGLNFPDALAAGSGSFAGQHPILLTGPDELHPAAENGLESSNTDAVFILGGTGVVSQDVEDELNSQGYETARLAGANRFQTAVEVANAFADEFGFGVQNVGLATGGTFADALSSAPFLGNPAPLVLTPSGQTQTATSDFFEQRGCDIETMDIFGGDAAVEPQVAESYAETACTTPDQAELTGASFTDGDGSGDVSDGDELSLDFSGEVALNTTVTLEGDNGEQIVLTDEGVDSSADPEEVAATFSLSSDGTTVNITVDGTPDTNLTSPVTVAGCSGITDADTGDPVDCGGADVSFDIPEAPSNQTFTVTPSGEEFNTFSTTTGADQDRGQREYTADVGSATEVDIGLIPADHVLQDDSTISFTDMDSPQNRADDLGNPIQPAVIEDVNGVSVSNAAYQDGIAPSGGQVTFTVDSTNANHAVIPVVFTDADDNNQLNLDSDDVPSEDFGIGGAKHWQPTEASAGTTTDRVAIALQDRDQFTFPGELFNYTLGGTDTFEYQSPGVADFTMTDAEWEDFLSGDLTRDGADTTNDETTGNDVLGDEVQVNYNPNGPSTFIILDDVPAAVSNVSATRNDNDTDGDENDITVEWDAPSNPDVDQYEVWRSEQPAGGNETAYTSQGTVPGGTTQFNQTDLNDDTTYRYRIVPFNDNGNEGPESAVGEATIPPETAEDTPVSEASQVNGDTDDILNSEDTLAFTFRHEPLTLGGSPSVQLIDEDGTQATIDGSNATFTVGGSDDEQLLIDMDSTPQITGTPGGANAEIDLNGGSPDFAEVVASSDIGNSAGPWNLAESGLGSDDPNTSNTEIRTFGVESNESGLPEEVPAADLSADPGADEISIAGGIGGPTIEDGDDFWVFDEQGTQIGNGTYSNSAGNTVGVSAFEPGQTVYLVYEDDNDVDLLSETAIIPNPDDVPDVVSVSRDGANDLIAVDWTDDDLGGASDDITQVGPPDNYEVYDSANNTLIATGEATSPSQGNATTDGCDPCTIQVDLDSDLTPGTDYTLRVAQDTVQDPNNTPNDAQTVPFGFSAEPSVSITSGPSGTISDTEPDFSGSAGDDVDVADVQARITSSSFSSLAGTTGDCDTTGGTPWTGSGDTSISWSCEADPLATGSTYTFEVRAQDSDGQLSTIASRTFTLISNAAPVILDDGDSVDFTDPSGTTTTSDGDTVNTASATPTFEGDADDPDSGDTITDVQYTIDGGPAQPATPSDGTFDSNAERWTFTPAGLSDGTHQIDIFATDNHGAVGDSQSPLYELEVVVDTTAPSAPSVTSVSSFGSAADDDDTPYLTGDATPTIDVSCEPGASVELLEGTTSEDTATCGAGGTASLTDSTSESDDAVITYTLRQTDTFGNTSADNNFNVEFETVDPIFTDVTASAGSNTLTLEFDIPVCETTAGDVDAGDFSVTYDGSSVAVSGHSFDDSSCSSTRTLTMATSPSVGQLVEVDIVSPGDIDDTSGGAGNTLDPADTTQDDQL